MALRSPVRALALLASLVWSGVGAPALAQAGAPQQLSVRDAWVRATVEGQTGSGVFLLLTSTDDARLVGASSPAAERVEIHEMRLVDDKMTMRRIPSLALPAGKTVAMDHDHHLMLIGLKGPLQPGQSVPVTLQWLDAKGSPHALDVLAPVRSLGTVARTAPPRRD